MTMTIPETADWLRARDGYLLITHLRPDGDTVGCAAALAQGLREIGKTAHVLYNPEITPRYSRFVKDYWAPDGYSPEHAIAIDTASRSLFPKNGGEYADAISLCIDHHPSNSMYAERACIDGSCASCGEIIYKLLMNMTGAVSAASAERLYVALSTDTGCFAFANTTAETLRIASLLIEAGAPHRELNRMLFRTRTRGRVNIEGMINTGIEFFCGGAVAIATITRKMVDAAGADEDDLDDIASIPGSIKGVNVGITIRELTSDSDCKVSVRTSPSVNAHAICSRFGGGGHAMAAGFSQESTVSEIKAALLDVLAEMLSVPI